MHFDSRLLEISMDNQATQDNVFVAGCPRYFLSLCETPGRLPSPAPPPRNTCVSLPDVKSNAYRLRQCQCGRWTNNMLHSAYWLM